MTNWNCRVCGMPNWNCSVCGKPVDENEMEVCADCGAIFCPECVEAGEFDDHECEDLED